MYLDCRLNRWNRFCFFCSELNDKLTGEISLKVYLFTKLTSSLALSLFEIPTALACEVYLDQSTESRKLGSRVFLGVCKVKNKLCIFGILNSVKGGGWGV